MMLGSRAAGCRRQRLVAQDIQRRACQFARLHGFDQRLFVDDAAAGNIDQARGRLHQRQALTPDQMARLRRQWHVQRQEVGACHQRVEIGQLTPR
jgi:hypothetical protein